MGRRHPEGKRTGIESSWLEQGCQPNVIQCEPLFARAALMVASSAQASIAETAVEILRSHAVVTYG